MGYRNIGAPPDAIGRGHRKLRQWNRKKPKNPDMTPRATASCCSRHNWTVKQAVRNRFKPRVGGQRFARGQGFAEAAYQVIHLLLLSGTAKTLSVVMSKRIQGFWNES